VRDAATNERIPFVTVFSSDQKRSAIGNSDGEVDLSVFTSSDSLIIRSIAYKALLTSLDNLASQNYQILLEPSSQKMETIVVSASKFKQRKKDIPQKIIAVDSDEVIFNNPQTSADLLNQTGQVFVQKSQQGGGSPMIRGFSTNRLLLTVDGVRMNNAIFRGGNLQNVISIDPLSVERTEVILGPGSVVYGSDAIGGVMNFYTEETAYSQDSLNFNGRVFARYATANVERTAHATFKLATQRFTSTTTVSANFFDDLKMGSDGPDDYLRFFYAARQGSMDVVLANPDPERQIPSGYDQLNLLQKFGFRSGGDWDFTLGAIYSSTSEYDRYDALSRFRESVDLNGQPILEPRQAEWYYAPQVWLLSYLKASHRGDGKLYNKAIFSQSYQLFKEGRNTRDFQQLQLFQNDERVDAFTTSLDFERYGDGGNTLFYGAEYVHNLVRSEGSVFNVDTRSSSINTSRYPDGSTWESLAVYANYQWRASRKLTLQSGMRYNHIWIDSIFDDMIFDLPFEKAHLDTGALTGAIGAVYRPADTWELRLNLSTAFRAPNIDDVGKIFEPSPGTVVVPNPELRSEYAYTSEIGIRFNPDRKFNVQLSTYYTYLDDALVIRDYSLNGQDYLPYQGAMSKVQAIQNEESARVYGIELALEAQLMDRLKVQAHYTTIDGKQYEQNGDEVPVRHVAPDFGDLHLLYDGKRIHLDTFVVFNGQLDFDQFSPSQQNRPWLYATDVSGNPFSPRWYTLNLRSMYELTTSLTAVAILENITDQRYRPYSSGLAAAGRNLILAMNYQF
jgi:hemoglobin/transferrin/lactoferrin receptor protein